MNRYFETFKAKLRGTVRSFTIWANGIAGSIYLGLPMLQDSLPQLQAYIPANFFQFLMGGVIVVNILLRFKTNTGLEHK